MIKATAIEPDSNKSKNIDTGKDDKKTEESSFALASPAPMVQDSAHNLDNLKNIPLDTDTLTKIQQQAQTIFGTNIQSQLSQQDLKDYYQESVVPQPDDPIVNQTAQSEMYKAYAVGMISEGINNNIDYLSIDDAKKLTYYQNVEVMQKNPTFVTEMQRLYGKAFGVIDEDIQWYRENNPSDWGQQLYDAITDQDTLNALVGQLVSSGTYDDVNRYGVILQALGRNDLSAQFQQSVFLQYNLITALTQITASADEASYFFKKMLYGILNDPNADSTLKQAINTMIQEEQDKDKEDRDTALEHIADTMADLSIGIEWANGMANAATDFGDAVLENYPKTKAVLGSSFLKGFGYALFIIAAATALFLAIQGGNQFKDLSTTEQIAYVTMMVQLASTFFVYVPKLTVLAIEKLSGRTAAEIPMGNDFVEMSNLNRAMTPVRREIADALDGAEQVAAEDAFSSRWPRVANYVEYGEKFLRVLGIVAAG
eukprot:CAMPEP_0201567836 /NCGR_PEP_ID=MMETSP0190_2-20130828/8526_1 /ASSEMBLY_ACC=CAM_ASM_000263 /TAXON_ID=37353 /ORGANISM="Rosalina sp." /LENGTH=483 /DNA_ID=CAMNT_0047988265 /DNA_START=293 /DNA_END=1740 /DNA_ORIENTATION=+